MQKVAQVRQVDGNLRTLSLVVLMLMFQLLPCVMGHISLIYSISGNLAALDPGSKSARVTYFCKVLKLR